jgi:hypothetical protein
MQLVQSKLFAKTLLTFLLQFAHLPPGEVRERHRRDGFEVRCAAQVRTPLTLRLTLAVRGPVGHRQQASNADGIFESTSSRQTGLKT